MKTTKTIERLKVVIRRPNGEIETVYKDDNVRYIGNNKHVQQHSIKSTKEAGKGDILSFEIVEEQVPMSLEEQRQDLVYTISGLLDAEYSARERDYNNDIGFHESQKYSTLIDIARQELIDFDASNPEIVAEINRLEEIKNAQLIQSALNN